MDGELLEQFDSLIARKGYPNRSEALRDLVRRAIVADAWGDEQAHVLGAVSIVYDHHHRELVNSLLDLQHDSVADIVCTTHVHLDHHHCLELLLVRGHAGDVRRLADTLIGLKGVKHGELMMTATADAAHDHPHA